MDAAAAASAGAAAGDAACAEAMDADGGDAAGPLEPNQAPGSAERVRSTHALEPSPAPDEKPLAKPARGKAGRKCAYTLAMGLQSRCMVA